MKKLCYWTKMRRPRYRQNRAHVRHSTVRVRDHFFFFGVVVVRRIHQNGGPTLWSHSGGPTVLVLQLFSGVSTHSLSSIASLDLL